MVKFDDASVLFYFSNINYVSIKGLFWALNCGPLVCVLTQGSTVWSDPLVNTRLKGITKTSKRQILKKYRYTSKGQILKKYRYIDRT